MVKKWELVRSEIVFKSPYVQVNKDQLRKGNGELAKDFYSVLRKNWVEVVAITEDGQLPLVLQYRNGIKEIIWSLPAGFIEEGQSALQAAERELAEETGFSASNFELIGEFAPSVGANAEKANLVVCQNAKKTGEQKLDQDEEIDVKLFNFEELVEKIKKGDHFLVDMGSVLGILLAWERFKK